MLLAGLSTSDSTHPIPSPPMPESKMPWPEIKGRKKMQCTLQFLFRTLVLGGAGEGLSLDC